MCTRNIWKGHIHQKKKQVFLSPKMSTYEFLEREPTIYVLNRCKMFLSVLCR